jgi:hypothetical protein
MTEAIGRMNATVREKFDLRKYSRLVSKVAPLVIETKEEFERADTRVADSRLIVRRCAGQLPAPHQVYAGFNERRHG